MGSCALFTRRRSLKQREAEPDTDYQVKAAEWWAKLTEIGGEGVTKSQATAAAGS